MIILVFILIFVIIYTITALGWLKIKYDKQNKTHQNQVIINNNLTEILKGYEQQTNTVAIGVENKPDGSKLIYTEQKPAHYN